MAYLASKNILHRDIKLENIMMTSDDKHATAVLADFGLSRVLAEGEQVSKSYGTKGYMAPEIMKDKEYGLKIDVWSLGVTLYALVSGYMPLKEREMKEVCSQSEEEF